MLFALIAVAEKSQAVETEEPQKGDVAAIVIFKNTVCGAIHLGDCWFTRNEEGVHIVPLDARVIKAWKLKCHKPLS